MTHRQESAVHDTGQDEKAAGGALGRRWSDDPWCNMTTGEAEAYRRGWRAAKLQAMRAARQVPIPEDCGVHEAHGRLMGSMDASSAISAMEPKS